MRPFAIPLLLTVLCAAAGAADGDWLTGWQQATARATATGRPILADFTGSDWCGWCMKLHREVFDTPGFRDWAARTAVPLVVDFPQNAPQTPAQAQENQALAERYGIKGFPTVLLLTADGREIGRLGYQAGGPQPWIAAAEAILAKAAR